MQGRFKRNYAVSAAFFVVSFLKKQNCFVSLCGCGGLRGTTRLLEAAALGHGLTLITCKSALDLDHMIAAVGGVQTLLMRNALKYGL